LRHYTLKSRYILVGPLFSRKAGRKHTDALEIIMALASACHILVKEKKLAEELKERLAKGEDFGKLAKQYSTCPSKKNGGNLGEFHKGDMVKAFDDVVFKRPLLKVQGPVKTQFGYHLIKTLYRS
jgi:peptidyl-prolyl cis-trans isomerase C